MRNALSVGMWAYLRAYACKGARALFTGQRDRERKREKERRGIWLLNLNGMTGAFAPFSYLVANALKLLTAKVL